MRSFFMDKKMANTDIKWFSFNNNNAPQLSNTWGCMIDVLDACLVTGFGSQNISSLIVKNGVATATFGTSHNLKQFQVIEISGATNAILNNEFKILGLTANTIEFLVDLPDLPDLPDQTVTGVISCKLASLGWTKEFTSTQKSVYRAKDKIANPFFLRIDNSRDPAYAENYAKFSKVAILETCTGINDVSGNQAPFDLSNLAKNWVGSGAGTSAIGGWLKWFHATAESGATNSAWSSSATSPDNGNRSWVLIGNKDSFYIVNNTVVSDSMYVPYGFGTVQHNTMPKPFLFATNNYVPAISNEVVATPLGNTGRAEVVTLYSNDGVLDNTVFSKLISGLNVASSGVTANTFKITEGHILTPFYLLDSSNFLIGEIPLAYCCANAASIANNHEIYTDEGKAYLACRIRTQTGGVLGVLFFCINEAS